jgi:hypothetical protein
MGLSGGTGFVVAGIVPVEGDTPTTIDRGG